MLGAAGPGRRGGGPGGRQEPPTAQTGKPKLQTWRKKKRERETHFSIRSGNTLERKENRPLCLVRKRKPIWEERTMKILIKQKETKGPSRIYCGRMWIYSVQKTTPMKVDRILCRNTHTDTHTTHTQTLLFIL